MGNAKNTLVITITISLTVTATMLSAPTARAGETKSDPANYRLDPEEIRPIVRDSLEGVARLSKKAGELLRHIETFDVRLIDGQLPIYSVSGEILAAIYIAYVVPGPLPSFDDIVNKRIEESEAINAFQGTPYEEREDYWEFYAARYPYEISCAYAIVGVSPKFPNQMEAAGIPNFIDCLPEAREAAAEYLGTNDFELVRILFWPGSAGYEFSDGNRDIVVPFDDWTGMVFKDKVFTRDEMDREPDKYEFALDENRARKWVELWQYKFAEGNSGLESTGSENTISDAGPFCYLPQTYYDHPSDPEEAKKVWKNIWLYAINHRCPQLQNKGFTEPEQYALFGTCIGIACASVLTYFEARVAPHLVKNHEWEGKEVNGFGGGSYYYPQMRPVSTTYEAPPLYNTTCNFASYMALLIGAIYQRYSGV